MAYPSSDIYSNRNSKYMFTMEYITDFSKAYN